ncbi:DNA-directed DNA polymerase alpha subunit pol12 [Entophlyctis luteolus]|nr:DNA-directed DNA polymerase alpha subunit pol12 [Entophlyctis luteolus]
MLGNDNDGASANIRAELVAEFGATLDLAKESSADALGQLVEWCSVYNETPESLAAKYEGIAVNSRTDAPELILDALRAKLQRDFDARVLGPNSFLRTSVSAPPLLTDGGSKRNKILTDDDVFALTQTQPSLSQGKLRARVRGGSSQQQQPMVATPQAQRYDQLPSGTQMTPGTKSQMHTVRTPLNMHQQPKTQISATPSGPAFHDRSDKGRIEFVFGENVPLSLNDGHRRQMNTKQRAEISLPPGQQMTGYRYMFERMSEKGDLVDTRIQELSFILDKWIHQNVALKENSDSMVGFKLQTYLPANIVQNDTENETFANDDVQRFLCLENPAIPHHTRFFTAGRIVASPTRDPSLTQPSTQTDKLNLDNLLLEPCRLLGGGSRMELRISASALERPGGVALFPGMIVGISAVNPTGRCIIVDEIFSVPCADFATTRADEVVRMYEGLAENGTGVLNMIVAAGPYSVDTGGGKASYEGLEELAKIAETERPDVVILCGPFVDEAMYLEGGPGLKYALHVEDVFKLQVAPLLSRMTENGTTRVIVIPSTRGLESPWVAYPQPPIGSSNFGNDVARSVIWNKLGIRELVAAGKLVLVPNPVQLSINEVLISVSNVDSLMHLSGEEFVAGQQGQNQPDRPSRLFKHHLSQRHLYPLSPQPISAAASTAATTLFALDTIRAHSGAITLQAMPDILVLPSALKACVRNVEGCVCINPGTVVKGRAGGGGFARVCVHPLDIAALRKMCRKRETVADGFNDAGMKRKAEQAENGDVMDLDSGVNEAEREVVLVEHSVQSRCRVELQKI